MLGLKTAIYDGKLSPLGKYRLRGLVSEYTGFRGFKRGPLPMKPRISDWRAFPINQRDSGPNHKPASVQANPQKTIGVRRISPSPALTTQRKAKAYYGGQFLGTARHWNSLGKYSAEQGPKGRQGLV